jgi:glyoxylase-like metal-dependent hydrolase (beta-lactamase superfamily II)
MPQEIRAINLGGVNCFFVKTGDLLYNFLGKPGSLSINDLADSNVSLEKLKKLHIHTVYPGHGKPFRWNAV